MDEMIPEEESNENQRYIWEDTWDLRELLDEWRNYGREERHEREFRGHTGHKRERLDEPKEHRTEKQQRSNGEREDRERDRAELHHKFSPLLDFLFYLWLIFS
jgi:hypothetical protein